MTVFCFGKSSCNHHNTDTVTNISKKIGRFNTVNKPFERKKTNSRKSFCYLIKEK